MKRVWKLCIRDDEGFDQRQGYAWASDETEARTIAGDPHGLQVFSKHPAMLWPGRPDERVCWSN